MTVTFAEFVAERFGGTLSYGSHDPNGAACEHEAVNMYRLTVLEGLSWDEALAKWSDDTTGTLDLRGLNDALWSSDAARTEAMLPLGPIVLAWPSWSDERQQAFARYVAEQTIRRILPPVLRRVAELVPEKAPELVAAALRCETEGSESAAQSARSAAWSAWSAQSAWPAWPAWSAAYSAQSAARSAESAESAARSAQAAAESAESAAESAESAAQSAATDAPLREFARIMVEAADARQEPSDGE